MILLYTVLALLISSSVSAAPTDGTCLGGYKDGEKVDKSSSWFECKNGQLIPKGCLTSNGDRLKIQDTYDTNNIRSECQLNNENVNPIMVNKSCVFDNKERQPGAKWDDSKYVYTCKKDGPIFTIQPTGCIRDGNRKLDTGERMLIKDVVYECRKENLVGFPTFKPWGCATKEGEQFAAGQSFESGDFWYTCQMKNEIVSLELGGCVNEKTHFKDGDKFFKNDLVFECIAKQGAGDTKVVGCMQQDPHGSMKIERRVGCTWYEGDEPLQVTMTCVPDQNKKTAMQTVVRCNYKMPGSTIYSIDIGCYRIYEKVAIGCLKNSNTGKVNPMQISVDDNGDVKSIPDGLKYC